MFKLIILILGIAIGFGGGVWWGQKNPEAAAALSAEEERRVLEAKLAITQKFREKLEQLQGTTTASTPGSGFVSSGQTSTAAEVKELKEEARQEEEELRRQLEKVK